jgi:hypothetical protein
MDGIQNQNPGHIPLTKSQHTNLSPELQHDPGYGQDASFGQVVSPTVDRWGVFRGVAFIDTRTSAT